MALAKRRRKQRSMHRMSLSISINNLLISFWLSFFDALSNDAQSLTPTRQFSSISFFLYFFNFQTEHVWHHLNIACFCVFCTCKNLTILQWTKAIAFVYNFWFSKLKFIASFPFNCKHSFLFAFQSIFFISSFI